MLFASPKKNFKIFSPTLQKKLKHPTHNQRLTGTLTGYDFDKQTQQLDTDEEGHPLTWYPMYIGLREIVW